ncbi:MAG TPA: hypothetical protein ENI08_02335 [Candidatus Dependentiae bacterium]|nr:hypothetical protein [Candidatus Dependentiae bacterium]
MRRDKELCDKIFSKVQEEEEGFFPNIDQPTLDHVLDLSTQQFEQFATLMGYSDDKLINIIKAANYLDAEGLLNRATSEFAINRAFSNTHLDQLLTLKGFDQYYEQLDLLAEMHNAIVKYLLKNHPSFRADLVKSRFWPKDWDVESITMVDGDFLISRTDGRTWRFGGSEFSSAMRNLSLKDAQVIKALMTGKITIETMPEHLREIYDDMPDVLQSLFTQ